MSWPSYDDFYVGYTKNIAKNATPVRIVDSNGDILNQYALVPDFTTGKLYDGHIIFCAKAGEGELRLHEIFQETLDTPVGVGSYAPDK